MSTYQKQLLLSNMKPNISVLEVGGSDYLAKLVGYLDPWDIVKISDLQSMEK